MPSVTSSTMASAPLVAVGPPAPLSKKKLAEKEAQIQQWRDEIEGIENEETQYYQKQLDAQKRKLEAVTAGKKTGNISAINKKIRDHQFSLRSMEGHIESIKTKIDEMREFIDGNDARDQAYTDYHLKAAAAARREAQKPVNHGLFSEPLGSQKNKIIKTKVRVPLAQQPNAINRPLRRACASTKATTEKVKTGAGVKKSTSSKDADKKTVAKEAASQKAEEKPETSEGSQEKIAQEPTSTKAEELDSAESTIADSASKASEPKPSPTAFESPAQETAAASGPSNSSTNDNKRKLRALFSNDEQSPAKKSRLEQKMKSKLPKKTRPTPASARGKSVRRTPAAAQSTVKTTESVNAAASASVPNAQTPVDEDVEMSDADDFDAAQNTADSKPEGEASASEATPDTVIDDSASKKPKATDHEESPPAKKLQPFPVEGAADAGETSSAAKDTADGPDSGEQQRAVAKGDSIELYLTGRPKGRWTSATAGEDWVLGQQALARRVDVSRPISTGSHELRGLLNPRNACFANSALQLLNAVLSNEQIQTLRCDADLSLFGMRYKDLMLQRDVNCLGEPANLEKLRSNISMTAAMHGNIEIGPYLGALLIDMREGASHKSAKDEGDEFVTPLFFQQVFAFGCGNVEARLRYDGSTQQDTQDYLMAIIGAVEDEGHAFLPGLFKINKTMTKKCTACADETTEEDSDTYMSVMPSQDAGSEETEHRLVDLLQGRLSEATRPEGFKCEKCSAKNSRETISAITKLPDHVVVHVKRTVMNKRGTKATKNRDAIEWMSDGTQFQFDGNDFEVAAVLRHKGAGTAKGHYNALIKHSNVWNHLDDDELDEDVEFEEMVDGRKGHCAVFLLRKLPQ